MQTISRQTVKIVSTFQKKHKPTIIRWKGIKMLRSQSINACVDEIYESSKGMGFLKINLIGASSSGKTVLSHVLAHQFHVRDPTFEVHFMKDSDLIDFRKTIQNLSHNNQFLVFDDLSGLEAKFGTTALKTLEAEITTIRHIDDMEDRKIVMVLNFHAQKKLSKFLRISNFTFYTDCQNEEVGYLEDYLGKNKKSMINKFKDMRASSRIFHKFTFNLSKGNKLTYLDGNPFRILLYNNSLSTRFVVSPQLEWILGDEKCPVCFPATQSNQTKIDKVQFMEDFKTKFGKGIAKRAVELKLLQMGKVTQPKRVVQAGMYINQYLAKKDIVIDDLIDEFGLTERSNIRLSPERQPEFVEEVNPLKENDQS